MPTKILPSPHAQDNRGTIKARPWERSCQFAVNPRGILTHRVRTVTTYYNSDGDTHNHVGYWCANGACFDLGLIDRYARWIESNADDILKYLSLWFAEKKKLYWEALIKNSLAAIEVDLLQKIQESSDGDSSAAGTAGS